MNLKYAKLLSAILLGLFVLLTIGVITNAGIVTFLDNRFFEFLNYRNTVNTNIFSTVATFGSPLFTIIVTIVLAIGVGIYHSRLLGIWILLTQFIGSGMAEVIKMLVQRNRPQHQLVPDAGFSYPSGHVFCTTILVLCTLFVLMNQLTDQEQKLVATLVGMLWIILVAISRVYLRDHYLTDVLASMLLASGFWLVMRVAQSRINYSVRMMLNRMGLSNEK